MKCPKCSYIGFETTDRCRNCGFDFSLSADAQGSAAASDLPMRPSEPMGPLADLDLAGGRRPDDATPQTRAGRRRHDGLAAGTPSTAVTPSDLPLFGDIPPDDVPLVRPAPTPTPPLSVRRSTPAPTRPRAPLGRRPSERETDALPLDTGMTVAPEPPPPSPTPAGDPEVAALGPRVGAALLDWTLLSGIDLAIVYFTLRATRLGTAEFSQLPLAPLAAFLLLLDGGYLALFTAASGQTIGKMAFGLKVVSALDGRLTVGRALVRAAAFLVGAGAAGLGLLPAVFDAAHRGLHDRIVNSRVVRVS
jgi:uncharacterized RDD family membrane protein YckC